MKMKEDRRIRREIVRAARGLTALAPQTNVSQASLALSDREWPGGAS